MENSEHLREHSPLGARIVIDHQCCNDYVGYYDADCYGNANEYTTLSNKKYLNLLV